MSCFIVSNKQLNVIVSSLIKLGKVKNEDAHKCIRLLSLLNAKSVNERYDIVNCYDYSYKEEKPLFEGVDLLRLNKFIDCYLYQCSNFEYKFLDELRAYNKKIFLKYADWLFHNGYGIHHDQKDDHKIPFYSDCDWSIEDYIKMKVIDDLCNVYDITIKDGYVINSSNPFVIGLFYDEEKNKLIDIDHQEISIQIKII